MDTRIVNACFVDLFYLLRFYLILKKFRLCLLIELVELYMRTSFPIFVSQCSSRLCSY